LLIIGSKSVRADLDSTHISVSLESRVSIKGKQRTFYRDMRLTATCQLCEWAIQRIGSICVWVCLKHVFC